MSIRTDRREAAIELMADHLLANGMAAASLRPLAAAAGTSDRMLLYYFADRDEIVTATVGRVAARLTVFLDHALPTGTRLSFNELLAAIWSVVRSAKLQPYMRLWLELVAGSARFQTPHRDVAASIMVRFLKWTTDHLLVDQDADDESLPTLLLATIEGALFLDAVGSHDLADTAIASAARQYGRSTIVQHLNAASPR